MILSKVDTKIEIFDTSPSDFVPQLEVASAFLNVDRKTLILQRAGNERGYWGLPGGKLEQNESAKQAARREFFEETGIQLPKDLKPVPTLYIRKPNIDYIFHMYQCSLPSIPDVILNSEHLDYGWFTLDEALNLQLMLGGLAVFQHYQIWLDNL